MVQNRNWINADGVWIAVDSVAAFEGFEKDVYASYAGTTAWLNGGHRLRLEISADEFRQLIEATNQ